MTSTSEITSVQNPIAINKQQLGPKLWFKFQAFKQHSVNWNLFKRQKSRDIRVLSLLDLVILIDHLHGCEIINHDVGHSIVLVVFAVGDIDGCDSLQRVRFTLF